MEYGPLGANDATVIAMPYLTWKSNQVDDLTNLFYDYVWTGDVSIPMPEPTDARWIKKNAKETLGKEDNICQITSGSPRRGQISQIFQMIKIYVGIPRDLTVTYKGFWGGGASSGFYYWNSGWNLRFSLDLINTEHTFNLTTAQVTSGMDAGGFIYFLVYGYIFMSIHSSLNTDYFRISPSDMNDYGTPIYPDTTQYLLGHEHNESASPQVEGENTVITNENTQDVRGKWFYGGEAYVTTGPALGQYYIFRVFVSYRVGLKTHYVISVSSPPVNVRDMYTGLITTTFTPIKIPQNPIGTTFIACYAGLYLYSNSSYIMCDNFGFNGYCVFARNKESGVTSFPAATQGDMQFKCLTCQDLPPQYGTVSWDV